ncbi:hypothetical protein STEG23_009720 [Scotinomys teguina]
MVPGRVDTATKRSTAEWTCSQMVHSRVDMQSDGPRQSGQAVRLSMAEWTCSQMVHSRVDVATEQSMAVSNSPG